MSFENIKNSQNNKTITWETFRNELKAKKADSETISKMRSIFYEIDVNKDMRLSQEEINNAFSLLNSIDSDQNGKISDHELKASGNSKKFGTENAEDINQFITSIQPKSNGSTEATVGAAQPPTTAEANQQPTSQIAPNTNTQETNDIPQEETLAETEQEAKSKEAKQQALTEYTVQPGDTPEKIAKKFGLTGEDAKEFIEHLKKQTNQKGWFIVGQKITLLGDHTEALKNMSGYTEDKTELNNRWSNTDAGKKAIAAAEAKKSSEASSARETENTKSQQASQPKVSTPPKDTTPQNQRVPIDSLNNYGKKAAAALKNQISGASLNSNTREMLAEKVKNPSVAYILESYPNLVTDIDDEWGMDINDVKKYIITPLNNRLRELGLQDQCIPDNVSKLDIAQVQKKCAEAAALIRKTDSQNGYVFTPEKGNEGKIHNPRLGTQQAKQASETQNSESKNTKNEAWKYLSMSEMSYPEPLQEKIIALRRLGVEVTVTRSKDGFKLALDEDKIKLTNQNWDRMMLSEFFKDKKTLLFDNEGNIIQENQQYPNKEVKTKYENGNAVSTETNYNQTVSYQAIDSQRTTKDNLPTPISLSRPNDIGEAGNQYADGLEKNKAALMKELNLTNEQYDNLAQLAMGIAEQETHFKNSTYKTTNQSRDEDVSTISKLKALINAVSNEIGKDDVFETDANYNSRSKVKELMDSIYYSDMSPEKKEWIFEKAASALDTLKSGKGDTIREYYKKYTDGTKSYGMTQIKVDQYVMGKNPKTGEYYNPGLVEQFKHFGINCGEDIRTDPEKQAIATLLFLNNKRIQAESELWQNRLEANNNNISDPQEQISTNDLIALLYNGSSKKLDALKEGNLKLSDAPYANNVKKYVDTWYNVSVDEAAKKRNDALNLESQGNNGKLGTVIFMPSAYTTDVTNNKEDIKTLEEALSKNSSIPQDLKLQLIAAVRKNEISFGYGLSADEAASITKKDAQLIMNKLNELKGRITNLVDPAKIRTEAKNIQAEFRSDYLQSRQVIVNDSDVNSGSIVPALATGEIVNERLATDRDTVVTSAHRNGRAGSAERAIERSNNAIEAGNYRGFAVQKDLGVNPYDSSGRYVTDTQRVLAEYASDVVADMGTNGQCLTGIKAALESAGIIEKGEIVYPKGHPDYGKPITKAKDLTYYLNAHPEMFEEVKYVSLGNGTSRELNASDIKNLPAGYIGVFIPGDGYEDQAGHTFVTNGNGQGYADEVDNLSWDDYKSNGSDSGKGEHGKFVIYKLSDNWTVDPNTGKLVYKG